MAGAGQPAPATGTLGATQIVSALFVENLEMREAPGPSTRIDMTRVTFSQAAPSPAPVTLTPHPLLQYSALLLSEYWLEPR